MTITCLLSTTLVSTFTCSLDLRLPFSLAFARIRCTAPITSDCCERKAFPRSVVHLMSPARFFTTSGSPARPWTLGSQSCLATASAKALSFKPVLVVSHCCNWMISSG